MSKVSGTARAPRQTRAPRQKGADGGHGVRFRLSVLLLCALAAVGLLSAGAIGLAGHSLHVETAQVRALRDDALRPMQDLKALSDTCVINVVAAAHKVRNGNFT
jgi:hypothetical protein